VARIKRVLRVTWQHFSSDNVGDLAAMLTYYAVFALFPFALFVISLTLLILPPETLQEGVWLAVQAAPRQLRPLANEHLQRFVDATSGGFALIGAGLALFGASRGALALGRALNTMHGVKETRPWWKLQLVAVAVTLGCALLVLVALGMLLAGPYVGHLIADRFGLGHVFETGWAIGRWIGAALLVMLVWAILLYFLPNLKRPFRWVTPGAIAGTIVWFGASQLFALYVANFGKYETTYGALGAVIVALTWLWLTNFALLLGGEVDDALDDLRREKKGGLPKVGKENDIVDREQKELVPAARSGVPAEIEPNDGVRGLARKIGDDLSTLAKDHIELGKIEMTKSLKKGLFDGVGALLAGIVALIGFGMLCATAVVALEPLIDPLWLRMLIMSLIYLVVGGGVAAMFANKLKHDGPHLKHTAWEAKRTVKTLKDTVQHG
jgi:membrane protein